MPTAHYQNSLTPPWLVKVGIVLWLGSLGTLVADGYFTGMRPVAADFLAFVGGMLISASAIKLLSWPTDETYYRAAFHTLVNREADYRRNGDAMRAEAAQQFQVLMIALLRPDLLETPAKAEP